eukprot:gene2505-54881_t
MLDVYYRRGDGFIIVYSLTDEESWKEAQEIHDELIKARPEFEDLAAEGCKVPVVRDLAAEGCKVPVRRVTRDEVERDTFHECIRSVKRHGVEDTFHECIRS